MIGFLGSTPTLKPFGYPRIEVFKYKILAPASTIENFGLS